MKNERGEYNAESYKATKSDRVFYPKSEIEFLISLRIVIYKIVIS